MKTLILCSLLALTHIAHAQNDSLLTAVPQSQEGFTASEPAVIRTVGWLETTPINDRWRAKAKLLLSWSTYSPAVTVAMDDRTTTFTHKNPDLGAAFIGGWIRYSVEHGYTKDQVECTVAGIQSAEKVYAANGRTLRKDKDFEQLAAMDGASLEKWVKTQLGVR
ncbi:MAG TPA: hypothetical protein VL547_07875 [Dinghuibacter sp.]|uniref:hypothetical protein n=1 Tax=Dinghuibacter sp. TaxID=2024697 RepID=UPI002C74A5C4|nr:hypothetical protein [Dinghuibacter sp.]HTJ11927.1 hypothetical protein [Dinghuibacter sp.]